jgi:acyl-CoA synthetase (NDP forming)
VGDSHNERLRLRAAQLTTTPPGVTAPSPGALTAMMEARSIALVGASQRPGSLGERMVAQVAASRPRPRLYPVNPRYREVGGLRCYPSLAALPEPVDLVLLGVPDAALEEQLTTAAGRGDRSAVIFGGAHDGPGRPPGLRDRLAGIARSAGMALCGAGCMGFLNVASGLRAIGYIEPDPAPAGPVALVTHSGSVFSALLRSGRGFGFTVAVSSGQELVTTAAAYARYALRLPETRVLALVLEAIRDAALLRSVLADAAKADVPVVLLAAGGSDNGRALVSAHSGALAAGEGAWSALADAYGVHRVGDLAELADTLELFACRRVRTPPAPAAPPPAAGPAVPAPGHSPATAPEPGLATVHDSGLERAHVADLAQQLGVPFAVIGAQTRARLAAVLDPGLEPGNPLDVWGTGRDTERQLTDALAAMAADPAVGVVALAVDLVPEFDGDESYPRAALAAAAGTSKPLAVLAGLPAAVDPVTARRLRAAGIPVLEGARSGLLALRHLLDHTAHPQPVAPLGDVVVVAPTTKKCDGCGNDQSPAPPSPQMNDVVVATPPIEQQRRHSTGDPVRAERWRAVLAAGPLDGTASFELLRDYGIPAVRVRAAVSCDAALAAAAELGYPVVLKTDEPGIAHKSDAGGVRLGLASSDALADAYRDLAARLGPRTLVCQTAAPGTEVLLGITRDPALGPLVVAGAGGVLAELLADRVVALPPVGYRAALLMLRRLRIFPLLAGARGAPRADLASAAGAITGLSVMAAELGDALDALDINPLICGPGGATAVDALAVPTGTARAPGTT